MNLLLTMMKRWQSALASLLLVMLLALPATAGGWKLDGYYWSGTATSAEVSWRQDYHSTGSYETDIKTRKDVFRNGAAIGQSYNQPTHAQVSTSGYPLWGGSSVRSKGIAEAKGTIGSSVYARFTWQRTMMSSYDTTIGNFHYYPDPDDNPPSYVYIREQASVSASTNIRQFDGNPTLYDYLRPWQGNYYEIQGSGMGLELGKASRPEYDTYNSWYYKPDYKAVIHKVAVSGDSVVVPSQTFSGEIKLSPGYEKEYPDQRTTASLYFGYTADALNFSLQASGFTAANSKQTASKETVDALVGLSWVYPNQLQTNEDGKVHAVPNPSDVLLNWKRFTGGDIDENAPLPYFEGVATFDLTAKGSDGQRPIYNSPTYTWTPQGTTAATEKFAVPGGEPQVTYTNNFQRSYAWNFGTASDDSVSFPQTTSVSVEMKDNDSADSEPLKAEVEINWLTTWSPTETGLQKNVVTSQNGQYVLPDGSPIAISAVKEGDTIMCFVEGDPGFSTDSGHVEKIRPVPFVDQVPGPGERIEPRVVGKIVPTGNGKQIVIFNSTPKVNPDDDPNAAGFDEIQQARQVAAASQQTYQTGKALVTAALEIQLELMKFAAFSPAEGVAIEGTIKGLAAVGEWAEAATSLRAGIKAAETGVEDARKAARLLEATKARGGLSGEALVNVEKEIKYWNGIAARNEQFIKDGTSELAVGERYVAEAAAKLKKGGCFVAGTPVWMGDGTTKPIEQVKVGDLVLSKNEQTGEIAPKKVTNTSVRHDIWTRKLTFDNGAILETTDEHPLYVGGCGFVKAKEVGIGNSIVTRAGPSAKVTAVQADVRQATVYNFTVDEFHTYFVGKDALWAHNQTCPTPQAQTVNANLNHVDQDFARHMYEGDTPGPNSPYNGDWTGGGAHTWDSLVGRSVNTRSDTIMSIKNVREDPFTGARSVDVERLRINADGTISDVRLITPNTPEIVGKTLWPKGMNQATINNKVERAFQEAIDGHTYSPGFNATVNPTTREWSAYVTAPNGNPMRIEGFLKSDGTLKPYTAYPSNTTGPAWATLPKDLW